MSMQQLEERKADLAQAIQRLEAGKAMLMDGFDDDVTPSPAMKAVMPTPAFPVDTLPPMMKRYVEELATALHCNANGLRGVD